MKRRCHGYAMGETNAEENWSSRDRCDGYGCDAGLEPSQNRVLNDQSGLYADFAGKWSVEAAKTAVEDFGPTVIGQKIEIVTADHQNKPDLAVSIARRWFEVEGVDMITDLNASSVALAVHELRGR